MDTALEVNRTRLYIYIYIIIDAKQSISSENVSIPLFTNVNKSLYSSINGKWILYKRKTSSNKKKKIFFSSSIEQTSILFEI